MKKLFCIFIIAFVCFTGLSAQDYPESNTNQLKTPLRVEFSYIPFSSADVKVAWSFPINDIFMFDAGLNINYLEIDPVIMLFYNFFASANKTSFPLQRTINILADASFWIKNLYLVCGTGICLTTLGNFYLFPVDVRLGWEPGARKNKTVVSKFEIGYFTNTYPATRTVLDDQGNEKTEWISVPNSNLMFSVGLSIRF